MRAASIWIIPLLLLTPCQGADDEDVRVESAEVDTDKDGQSDVRTEIVKRGNDKLMMVMRRRDKSGSWRTTTRSFYAGEHMSVTESDEDGDEFFENLVVYGDNPEAVGMFVRGKEGSVRPADVKTLTALRKQTALISELWSSPMARDPKKIDSAIEETRDRVNSPAAGASQGAAGLHRRAEHVTLVANVKTHTNN
jgi:hypothetical protein